MGELKLKAALRFVGSLFVASERGGEKTEGCNFSFICTLTTTRLPGVLTKIGSIKFQFTSPTPGVNPTTVIFHTSSSSQHMLKLAPNFPKQIKSLIHFSVRHRMKNNFPVSHHNAKSISNM